MSGPKTARYVLTEEQRRRIAEQQRIRRETKLAKDKRGKLIGKCKNSLLETIALVDELGKLCAESGMETDSFQSICQKRKEIETQILSFEKNTDFVGVHKLQEENRYLEHLLCQSQETGTMSRELVGKVSSDYRQKLSDVIAKGFTFSFSDLCTQRGKCDNPFLLKINEALKRVEGIELAPPLIKKLQQIRKYADEISNEDFLENFCSMQVYPFVQECEFYRDHAAEFEELSDSYAYLKTEMGERAEEFVFSAESMEKLRTEIARLNEKLLCREEQEYISAAIDEAMTELGYELIGEKSITKKSGKRVRNGLYTLEEGTAVNVTFSDSGQISMELGALDTTDRTPTGGEAEELADDMRAFCLDYAALEKKLSERGIAVRKMSDLPAFAEYAQVFNISDYELKRPVEVSERRERKATGRKQQYKEG